MKNQFNNFVCNNRLINQILPQGEGADFWKDTLKDRPTAGGSSSQGETSGKKGVSIIEQAQKQLAKIDKPEDKVHNIEARVTRAFLKVAALTEQLQPLLHPQPKPQEEEPTPTQELLAKNLAQAQKDFDEAFAKTTELTAMRPGTKEAQKAWQEYDLAEQNLKEAKRLAANPAEYAERVAKLEKRQLTPAQKLVKTREFIKGKTGKDAELIKQRLDVDLAAEKPEEAEAAIKKLQVALGMSEKDQDGIVGKKTFNRLAALAALETPKQPLTAEKQRQIANEVQLHMGKINLYFKRAQTNPRKDSTDLTQYKTAMTAIEEKLGALRGYEKQLTQVYEMPSDFYVTTTRFGRIDFVRQRFDVAKAFGGREQELQYAKMKIDLRDSVLPAAEAAEAAATDATGL